MSTLSLRDVPDDLHQWLKQQAGANRRSLNREVIQQLDALRLQATSATALDGPAARLARIRVIAQASARLTVQDSRPEAEILGLGPDGLPA